METAKPKRVWTVLNLFSYVHVHQVEICLNDFLFHKDQSAQWVNMFLFPIFWAKLYKIVDLWGKNTLSHKSRKIHWNLLDHMQMILNFYNALHFTFRHLTLREYAWLHCAHLQDKEFTLKVTFALPIFFQ